jgi:hypothetical protein
MCLSFRSIDGGFAALFAEKLCFSEHPAYIFAAVPPSAKNGGLASKQ